MSSRTQRVLYYLIMLKVCLGNLLIRDSESVASVTHTSICQIKIGVWSRFMIARVNLVMNGFSVDLVSVWSNS